MVDIRRKIKEQEQKNSYSNYEPHSVVDLDDLNRELSQEIRKIYEPREKKCIDFRSDQKYNMIKI